MTVADVDALVGNASIHLECEFIAKDHLPSDSPKIHVQSDP